MTITKILKEIGRNAHIDWIAILCVIVATIVGLAKAGFSLYNAVVTGSVNEGKQAPVVSAPKYDVKAISSVVDSFKAREEVSRQARVGYKGAGDPSL